MVDVTVKSEDVANLVRAIRKHADAKAFRREMYRGLSSASKPVREEMRAAAIASLPVSGGLQARMAGLASKGRTSIAGGGNAGVRINFGSSKYDPRTLRGRIRHPLFGNRLAWFETPAKTDEIEHEFNRQKPEVQRAIQESLDVIARKVTNI